MELEAIDGDLGGEKPMRRPWQDFEKARVLIRNEYLVAKERGAVWPADADTRLKRLVYEFIRWILRKEKLELLKAYVRRHAKPRGKQSDNPFLWGLLLVDGPKRDQFMQKLKRSRYARIMQLANDLDVYPLYLAYFEHGLRGARNISETINKKDPSWAWTRPLSAKRFKARRRPKPSSTDGTPGPTARQKS